MNNQEIFDRVCQHAAQMKEQCVDAETNECIYWNEETGNRCFIGALISNRQAIWADSGPFVVEAFETIRQLNLDMDPSLCQSLQDIHDGAPREKWPEKLATVASRFRLDPKAVQQVGIRWNTEE